MSQHEHITTQADVAEMAASFRADHPGHMTFMAEVYDPLAAHQYPWMAILVFLIMYFGSLVVDSCFAYLSPSFWGKELGTDKKRIAITYIHELIVTSVSVGFLLAGGHHAFTGDMEKTTSTELQYVSYGVVLISALYIWELVYRHNFGIPLMVHHLVTIVMVQAIMLDLNKAPNLDRLRCAIVIAFTATTEQTSFVALLLHRFQFRGAASCLFYISAAQSLIIKTAAFIAGLSIFAAASFVKSPTDGYSHFWKWLYVPLSVALYASQAYACYILFVLGKRSARQHDKTPSQGESDVKFGATSSESDESSTVPASYPSSCYGSGDIVVCVNKHPTELGVSTADLTFAVSASSSQSETGSLV